MYFTDIFIRRPVFATVLSLIIFLIGLQAFFSLPIREYPNIQPSVINVETSYSGASAKLMEGFVTTPLENALGSVQGIDFMNSSSTQGRTNITLHFKLGYDINTAMADVSNAVSAVRSVLPSQIDDPVISKEDPSATPTIYFSFFSHSMSPEAITDYIIRVIQPQLQVLPGVSQAQILNKREYAMRLWLDPKLMAAHNITPNDLLDALNKNNVQSAPGLLRAPQLQIDVNAKTDLVSVEQFNNMAIQNKNGYLVRLHDIGYATLGPRDDTVTVNINGVKRTIIMSVVPQATANPLEVSKEVNALLVKIKQGMPAALHVNVDWDSSKFIAASLKEVHKTFIEATIFVICVIFLFLGSIRAVLIPVITIPLSIIGVCGIMLMLGYTINTLTLLAWVLAIGLVVDDAIVVLENIHRHIELGKKPIEAGLIGAREIGFAIIAMTLTLAAVYAPIGFMTDMTGLLFREFAFTLAGAVIVSGFVALTLTPMMCTKLLSHELNKKGLVAKTDEIFNSLMLKYRKILQSALERRNWILIGGAIIYLSCYFLYKSLPNELAPYEDKGAVIVVMSGPTAATIPYLEKYTDRLQKIYNDIPEKEGFIIANGYPNSSSAISFLVLKAWGERERGVDQIIKSLFLPLSQIPGITAFPVNLSPLPISEGRTPIEFVLKSTSSYEELMTSANKLIAAAQKNPGMINLDADLKLNKPQITLNIDRNKASSLELHQEHFDALTPPRDIVWTPVPNLAEDRPRAYQQDDRSRLVCHCEMVTEAEIVAAFESPLPVATLGGLRRRTRCMMGRCQGFYCTRQIAEIAAGRIAELPPPDAARKIA